MVGAGDQLQICFIDENPRYGEDRARMDRTVGICVGLWSLGASEQKLEDRAWAPEEELSGY
jgi:hypothetical protein